MKKFKIYAGLGGSFGGAEYQCTIEAKDIEEATQYAYQIAEEIYQSYEGYHGLMSWEECLEDLRDSEMIDEDMSDNEIEDTVNAHYLDTIESWIDYYAVEATRENEEEEE